jgi:hypothetical protein
MFITSRHCFFLATLAASTMAASTQMAFAQYTYVDAINSSPIKSQIINGRLYSEPTYFWVNGGGDGLYYTTPLLAVQAGGVEQLCKSLGGAFIGLISDGPSGTSYSGNCGKTRYGDPDSRVPAIRQSVCPPNFGYPWGSIGELCGYVCDDPSSKYWGAKTVDGCVAVMEVHTKPRQSCSSDPEQGNPIYPTGGVKREVVDMGMQFAGRALSFAYDSARAPWGGRFYRY